MSSVIRPAIKFAKIITSDIKEAARVSFDTYVMDKRLVMFFKEKTEEYAFKENVTCDEGDHVLIREIPVVPMDGKKIKYKIEKRIYKLGHLIEPASGKRTAQTEYVDEIRKTAEQFGYHRSYFKSES